MNSVGWFEIYCEDLTRAAAFYGAVFQCEFEPNEFDDGDLEMRMFPGDYSAYGATGALCKWSKAKPGVGGTTVYFSCEDCAVEESRVADAGGVVVQPKYDIGRHGFVSMIQDTEGNLIGLHSMK